MYRIILHAGKVAPKHCYNCVISYGIYTLYFLSCYLYARYSHILHAYNIYHFASQKNVTIKMLGQVPISTKKEHRYDKIIVLYTMSRCMCHALHASGTLLAMLFKAVLSCNDCMSC